MLSWKNQKDWSREQATPKREQVIVIQMVFSQMMLSSKHWSKDEASKSQQDSALDHKWFSFHMGGDSNIDIGLHQSINWTSHCYWRNILESMWLSSSPT